MKKTQQHLFFHGRTVKLYRDDIEEILDILTTHCEKVIIASYDYEYESLDELKSKRGTDLKQIELKGRSPYVYFHASRGSMGRSWVSADGEGAETPYFLISNLLTQHKRKLLRLIFNPILCIFYAASVTTLMLVFRQHFKATASFVVVMLFYSSFLITLLLLAMGTFLGELSIITLKRKHEQSSFWSNNKEKVWLMIIGAIIGGILTKAIGFLLSKLGM